MERRARKVMGMERRKYMRGMDGVDDGVFGRNRV
jgi:hypothetical protein